MSRDIEGEPFPVLTDRSKWYNTKLLRREIGNVKDELAYNTQLEWMNRAYGLAGVATTKKIHAGRGSAPKCAELRGVSEEQIRRAGEFTFP